jgi:hypothetical protein
MIWGEWIDPNFKFKASDREGRLYKHFCYAKGANDEERKLELECRLTNQGLVVEWTKPYDFKEWRDRAETARGEVIAAQKAGKKPIPFNDAIWGELKWHLFDLFHGKCAYCETKTQVDARGEVDHYRPKSKVYEDPDHPGYYWLAYEITNLLPACSLCNQAPAKSIHFPVQDKHARTPHSRLSDEQPLLLNPYDHHIDPCKHLEFGPMGEVKSFNRSPYGENSRICYNLNRNGLPEARRTAQVLVRRDWNLLTGVLASMELDDMQKEIASRLRKRIAMGTREYSAAQIWELKRIVASSSIGSPLPTGPPLPSAAAAAAGSVS